MLRVAYGSASWLVTPLGFGLLLLGFSFQFQSVILQQLAMVPLFLFLFFWFFFRDPERAIADGVVCPADGKVVRIDEIEDPDIGPADRIAVFMSPFNVHVNRFSFEGDVRGVEHIPGKHVPAFNKDSDRNERVITSMRTEIGDIKIIQIAGAVARRIVPYSQKGDHVHKGERLGLIRLGSRCDLIVPRGSIEFQVKVGDRVRANLTCIGKVRE